MTGHRSYSCPVIRLIALLEIGFTIALEPHRQADDWQRTVAIARSRPQHPSAAAAF
jgi:hypothetical protein